MQIRPPRPTDGMEIAAIHAEGLATGHASFRDDPMDWDAFADSFAQALIAEDGGMVLGFAGVSATSARPVYAGVGEVSTYVSLRAQRRGVGRALLSALIAESEGQGWWTLVAQIFPENRSSIALHQALGFQALGVRTRLGQMSYGPLAGQWRDVVMLERRSTVAGIPAT